MNRYPQTEYPYKAQVLSFIVGLNFIWFCFFEKKPAPVPAPPVTQVQQPTPLELLPDYEETDLPPPQPLPACLESTQQKLERMAQLTRPEKPETK